MFSAQATTDSLGRQMYGDLDFTNLRAAELGERKDPWERQVSFKEDVDVNTALTKDKYLKYDLLLRTLLNDGKISTNDIIALYTSGNIKEVRFGKTRYRTQGTKYLGGRKIEKVV